MVLAPTEYNYYTKAGQTYSSPYLILIPICVVLVIILTGCVINWAIKRKQIQVEKDKLRDKTLAKTKDLSTKKGEALNLKKKKSKISMKVKVNLNEENR